MKRTAIAALALAGLGLTACQSDEMSQEYAPGAQEAPQGFATTNLRFDKM